MLLFHIRRLLPIGLSLIALAAQAQSDPGGSASAASLPYRSAFAQYRKFNEQPVASWSETNRTVGAIGGWRTYAKEASQPEPVDGSAAPAPAAQGVQGVKDDGARPAPESHVGHGGKP